MISMDKRGQITVFIIVGILILFLVVSLVFFIRPVEEEQIEVPEELNAVKLYIESCIEDVGKDAIIDNSLQGGFYQLPEISTEGYFVDAPYYFYRLERRVPSLNDLQIQLGFNLEDNLKNCINTTQFPGINIELGDVISNVLIRESSVIFNVNMPVTIRKEEKVTSLQDFSSTIQNIRLLTAYNSAKEIIDEQANDPYSLCLSCLSEIANINGMLIDTANIDDNSLLFTITDLNSVIDEEPLTFRFANKYIEYGCDNLPSTLEDSVLQSKLIECAQQR